MATGRQQLHELDSRRPVAVAATSKRTSTAARLFESLRRRRRALEDKLAHQGHPEALSLARYRLHHSLIEVVNEYAQGPCLDAGSGHSPFKKLMQEKGFAVTSLDVEDRIGEVDLVADIQGMPEVASDSFGSILCTQVLEHVPRPWDAFAEFARVLRPGGTLIVSVPHLSAIHEAPHDYYRYTRFGLEALAKQVGLDVLELKPTSGLVAFLAHPMSWLLGSTLGTLPLCGWMARTVNSLVLVRLAGLLDRLLGLPGRYPCDYVLVARKPIG